jgi:threonine synthase
MQIKSCLTHLECSKTGKTYDAGALQNLSDAGAPLLTRYDLHSTKTLNVSASLFA